MTAFLASVFLLCLLTGAAMLAGLFAYVVFAGVRALWMGFFPADEPRATTVWGEFRAGLGRAVRRFWCEVRGGQS